jgi:hypothetical protein
MSNLCKSSEQFDNITGVIQQVTMAYMYVSFLVSHMAYYALCITTTILTTQPKSQSAEFNFSVFAIYCNYVDYIFHVLLSLI